MIVLAEADPCPVGWDPPKCEQINFCDGCLRNGYRLDRSTIQMAEDMVCSVCGKPVVWVSCPTGGWWSHLDHPDDDHDATDVYPLEEDP